MKTNAPQVSIGIPVYNGATYLPAALDCLLNQTYCDFEIVISDNASTDETQAICQRYAERDARVRYHRVEQNQGINWNFNRVVELSQGKYFTWAAHDDLRGDTFLQQCVDVLEQNPDVVVCHTHSTCIDATGAVIPPESRPDFTSSAAHEMTVEEDTRRTARLLSRQPHRRLEGVLMYTTFCHEIYGVIRLAALKQTCLLRSYFGSDMVLLAELSLIGHIHVLPDVLFFSRSHAAQASLSQGEPTTPSAVISSPSKLRHRFVLPRKIRYPASLFSLLFTARLSLIERAKCTGVLLKFGLQPKKWRGIHQDLRVAIKQRAARKTSGTNDAKIVRAS